MRTNNAAGVAVFSRFSATPPDLIRDRDRSRESARSVNLRAIGALGAAKRPLQLPQESRSRLPRCEGDRPRSRFFQRNRANANTRRSPHDGHGAANAVDRMHRGTRSRRRNVLGGAQGTTTESYEPRTPRPHRQRSPSPSVAVVALSPSNAASRIAASRRWSLAARSADRAGSWSETYVCDLAPTMSWNRAWRRPSSRGSLHG